MTLQDLQKIKKAMDAIQPMDQSDYFKKYYAEVIERIKAKERDSARLN